MKQEERLTSTDWSINGQAEIYQYLSSIPQYNIRHHQTLCSCVRRTAEYEDTGLSPAEVEVLKHRAEVAEKSMDRDFIQKQIIDLQNARTATEITEKAIFFTRILEQNAKLTEQLKNSVVLPCKVGDTVYLVNGIIVEEDKVEEYKVEEYKVVGFLYTTEGGLRLRLGDFIAPVVDLFLGKSLFFTKSEAEARLAELGGKSNDTN